MKYIIDAQLPPLFCEVIQKLGFDAIHVHDLPQKDETKDSEIAFFADSNQRVVVTKDADFFYAHKLLQKPQKLLLISTGNIKNRDLFNLIRAKFVTIDKLLFEYNLLN